MRYGYFMRVLIVEDSNLMRALIRRVLRDVASEISECCDGAEALVAYKEFNPDWVLMDIKMNRVDGIAATREIKAVFPDARILIVTDYNDPALRDAALIAGACGYVLKENLFDVRRFLSKE